ncbi:FecR family protein [Sphingobacterium sp. KU25419]|nr:FecR family protein [Sphingobacterium sp. KU25419]
MEKLYSFPDSSTAILQPNSSLEHAHDFLVNRTIHQLTGDVYYAVQKDSIHAFQVLANGIITTAIGTEFRVRNNAKNNQVEITLVEGKVKLSSVDVDFAMDIFI